MRLKKLVQKIDFSILLHDIRSVQNVASIFRMAEVLGVNTIYLSGVTPGPLDRFGFERADFLKISLGTEKRVKWERIENVEKFIPQFKAGTDLVNTSFPTKVKQVEIIALEQNAKSVDYKKVAEKIHTPGGLCKKYLIIPGREVKGIDKKLLKMCDVVAEIPQYGSKESLNIFSAMSVACFRFFDQN